MSNRYDPEVLNQYLGRLEAKLDEKEAIKQNASEEIATVNDGISAILDEAKNKDGISRLALSELHDMQKDERRKKKRHEKLDPEALQDLEMMLDVLVPGSGMTASSI